MDVADRGYLIAIEGIDGAGKTTQSSLLAASLKAHGHPVVLTREPTKGRFGEEIRRLALAGERAEPSAELRLFFEDRNEHVQEVIAPKLESGFVVVSDRYFLSTVAYQGARGLDAEDILLQCEAKFPVPDLAIILDVDPKVGLERVRARGTPLEAFERLDRLTAVSRVFRSISRPYVASVDGCPEQHTVERSIQQVVRSHLGLL